jgi:cell fate regulator YaaT (PSP1 superfamily)
MDMNDKKPAAADQGEGGQGKSHKHGRNRNRNRKRHKNREGAVQDTATSNAQVQNQDAQGKKKQPQQQKNAPQQSSAKNADTGSHSAHRPRVHHAPRKQAELPQMDNLLIDDAPVEAMEAHSDEHDQNEIERILSHDIFANQSTEIPEVIPEGKVVIVGIRFRTGSKVYFFDPGKLICKAGQYAIVETARGMEFGEVCIGNRMVDESLVVPPLRPVVRIATLQDIQINESNREREEEAFKIGMEKIMAHKLDMKLVAVQYTFDNSKLLFYFTSAGRVDFRELVKDLAGVFHIRIELRQIGIRDEARMLGGLGGCGRPLCCSSFLSDFGQVSMKMAKEQNLSLNSTKISGVCGRLMCCLRYEHETYAEELRKPPHVGTFVQTPDGPGVVTEIIPLAGEVKVSLKNAPDTPPKKYKRADVTAQAGGNRNQPQHSVEEDTEPDTDE